MAGLQMSGLASGLDTSSLISQLMQVERIPRGRMERQQAAVQQRQDFLKELSTKLKTLRSASAELSSTATWSPTRTATSADPARVAARPTGALTPGTYDVEVTALATASTQNWTVRSRPNATDLTITASATGTATAVAIPANATLDQIVSTINATTASPVTAFNDNGQLKLTSKALGASSGFTVTGQALDVAGTATTGTNAAYKVNGAAYTSNTNVATAGIPGVELTLGAVTIAGTPVRITTNETPTDKTTVAAKLKTYVEAYNAVVDFSRAKLAEKPNSKAATVTEAKVGVLYGDRGLTQVLHKLRNALMNPLAGHSLSQDEMHEIGLSTGGAVSTVQSEKVAGRLTFDETKFGKAWDANRADVEKLLRGGGPAEGFATRMDALLGPLVESAGLFEGRINGAQSELKTLAGAMERMDRRLSRKEEFYRRQFTQLETALAKSQTLQSQMAGQLAGLGSGSK